MNQFTLKKAIVKEKISLFEYVVQDILDESLIDMRLSGKQAMHFFPKIGEEVYVQCNLDKPSKGSFVNSYNFKYDWDLSNQQKALDKRLEEMKNKKENEINQRGCQDMNEGIE